MRESGTFQSHISQISAKLVRLKNQIPIVRLIFVCQVSAAAGRFKRHGDRKGF